MGPKGYRHSRPSDHVTTCNSDVTGSLGSHLTTVQLLHVAVICAGPCQRLACRLVLEDTNATFFTVGDENGLF
jgi:hypothetical protein